MDNDFDYIIAGAGASGLSLAWRLLHSPLREKEILVIDTSLTPRDDKTWCFWDDDAPPFSDLFQKKWNNVEVGISGERDIKPLQEFTYYCIRSIDFSKHILSKLSERSNITLIEDIVVSLESDHNRASLYTDTKSYTADFIFQSCFKPKSIEKSPSHYPLLQHFMGWEVETGQAVFDDSAITFMDFDETFDGGLAFMYILPWSETSALLEYTIFSNETLKAEFYEEKISLYLNHRFNLQPIDYNITRKEVGSIPMQDRPTVLWYKPNILNIGIQGGVTKPSTGYTFRRIQKQSESIIEALKNGQLTGVDHISKKRFKAYDLWLLQIIHDHPQQAMDVFHHLFKNNSMDQIFRFLSEETNLMQELKIMNSVPAFPFIRAMWKTADRLRKI